MQKTIRLQIAIILVLALSGLVACGDAQFGKVATSGEGASSANASNNSSASSASSLFAASNTVVAVSAPISRGEGLIAVAQTHTATLNAQLGSDFEALDSSAISEVEAPTNSEYYGPISQIENAEDQLLNSIGASSFHPSTAARSDAQTQLLRLQSLNVTNLGADIQVLIQANIVVLQALASKP